MIIRYKHKSFKWPSVNYEYEYCCDTMQEQIEHDKTEIWFNALDLNGSLYFQIKNIKNKFNVTIPIYFCPWCQKEIKFEKIELVKK